MNIEDIDYFREKKLAQPSVFALAQKVYDACKKDSKNSTEMQRRLTELSRSRDEEHSRQCSNFMAELVAFDELLDQGLSPN